MPNHDKLHEVKCPTCGAPLHVTGERIVCDYCGSVLERPRPAVQEKPIPVEKQTPSVVVIQTEFSARQSQQKTGGSACALFLLLPILIVGAVLAFIWYQSDNLWSQFSLADLTQLPVKIANTVSITSLSEIILLPASDNASANFMTFTYDTGAETYRLTYVDPLSSTIRWQSPPLQEWHAAGVLYSPDTIYLTDQAALLALNRSDGQLLWRTSMADKLTSGCLDCFQRFDNRLVVLTTGGTVQGIEAQTGQLIWSLRLNFEVANRLTAAGDRLIVYDRSEDNRDELMLVVNPVNGDVVSRTVISECAGRGFDQYHPNFYNPQQDELYLIFGDIIGPVCVQAWNVAGQQIVREIILEGTSLPSDFREYEHEQLRAIFAGEKLYLSAQQKAGNVEEGTVISIDVATGQWQILAHTPDYELIPLGMADDLLIVRAIRSRGTSRSELWGLDLASGEPRWQYVLQAQRWFKETGSEPAWDWRLSPHGLVVLQLFSDPDQLVVEKLNPQTGVSSGQNTIPLGDDFLTGIVWTDEAAWLALRKIYAVDLATSSLSYTWP